MKKQTPGAAPYGIETDFPGAMEFNAVCEAGKIVPGRMLLSGSFREHYKHGLMGFKSKDDRCPAVILGEFSSNKSIDFDMNSLLCIRRSFGKAEDALMRSIVFTARNGWRHGIEKNNKYFGGRVVGFYNP